MNKFRYVFHVHVTTAVKIFIWLHLLLWIPYSASFMGHYDGHWTTSCRNTNHLRKDPNKAKKKMDKMIQWTVKSTSSTMVMFTSSLSDALGEIYDDELSSSSSSSSSSFHKTRKQPSTERYSDSLDSPTTTYIPRRNKQQIKKLKFLMNEDVETLIQAKHYTGAVQKAHENLERLQEMLDLEPDPECKQVYKPTTHNWNMLIRAHGKSQTKDAPQKAEIILRQLENIYLQTRDPDVKPTVISYTEVIDSYAKSNSRNSADKAETILFKMMELAEKDDGTYDEDVAPTSITCDAVLNAWARQGTMQGAERAEQILERMEYIRTRGKSRTKIQPTAYSFATVITAWAKASKPGETFSGERAQHILKRMMEFRKEILAQEGPDSDYAKLLKPDVVVYNSVLDAWARTKTPIAGTKAEEILFQMQEVARMGDGNIHVLPDTITYNSVINCHASSGHINSAKAAEKILKKMEIASRTISAVVPNTLTYNQVLKAYSTSKLPGGTKRADTILRYMIQSGNKNIEPDSFSFTTVLNIWAKSKEPFKAKQAWDILNKMLETYSLTGNENMKPNEVTYNTVLNACAFSAYTPNDEKKNALSIAMTLFDEMRKSDLVRPDSVSYGNMLKCITNLVPKGDIRNKMTIDVFKKCKDEGLVSGMVFDEVRTAVPVPVLTELLSEAIKLRRHGGIEENLFSEWSLRDLPKKWKSNVNELRPKKRKTRTNKRPEADVVVRRQEDSEDTTTVIRPFRNIIETSWQSGRDV